MVLKRILIVNPFGIGDVLFTLPLVSNLRKAYPDAFIGYMGNRRTEPILKAQSDINAVFSYERDEFVAEYKKSPVHLLRRWKLFYEEIKQYEFDIVFDLSMNQGLGFFLKLCGIPRRVGFDFRGRGRFLTERMVIPGYENRHVIEHYADLLKMAHIPIVDLNMRLSIPGVDHAWVDAWLKDQDIKSGQFIIIVPGGGISWGQGALMRRWPTERYYEIIQRLLATTNFTVVLVGDSKDHDLFSGWSKELGSRVISVAGQTTLLQAGALMKRARVSLINDSGLVHLAVACEAKVAAIYGPVDPRVYGPYPLSSATVITKGLMCQPCYRFFRMSTCSHLSCLNALSIDDVYDYLKIYF